MAYNVVGFYLGYNNMNRIVTLCGSKRFDFEETQLQLTLKGLVVIGLAGKQEKELDKYTKEYLDLVHFAKIASSDAVFVLGDGYIGDSTAKEICFADLCGKPIIHQLDCPSWTHDAIKIKAGDYKHDIILKAQQKLGYEFKKDDMPHYRSHN